MGFEQGKDGMDTLPVGGELVQKAAGFRLEFTTTAHNNLLLERFFRLLMVELLTPRTACSPVTLFTTTQKFQTIRSVRGYCNRN